jgi:signal transduction histidine kinase/CheY-like chemotaxis protein
MRIRSQLVLLVAAALLPVLVFAAVLTWMFWTEQRTAFEQRYLERARAMAIALDGELESSIRTLAGLAAAPELEAGDLPRFYERARRVLVTQPAWFTVSLVGATGDQLLNLQRPLGAVLPGLGDRDAFRRALSTRRPAVSGLVRATLTGQYATEVAVPVVSADGVAYVLCASIDLPVWLRFLSRYPVAPDATMTLLDADGIVIARTLNNDRWVGRRPPSSLYDRSRSSAEGAYRAVGLEGQLFSAAHSRSAVSGWTVATGVPVAGIEAALRTSTMAMGGGAVVAGLFVLLLTFVFGRRIAGPMAALAQSARGWASGAEVAPPPTRGVAEVVELGSALDDAGRLLREREQALGRALVREQEARAVSEAANRAKDEFLSMLSHELRNPIGTITSAVAVMGRPEAESGSTARAREVIERQARHLGDLVDDLLDVARVTSGKIVLRRRPLRLDDAAHRAVRALHEAGRLAGHRVEETREEAWVLADEARLEQVVENLLENAAKYTPRGGRIAVRVWTSGTEAIVEVRDTGTGIAPDLLPRVFDLFAQGERSLDRSQGGLGLGLTLVRSLVHLHEGHVEAFSEGLGRGATFTVRLPRIEPPSVAAAAPVEAADAPSPRRRVLVVEDNPDGREMLRVLLGLYGHEVHEAEDGPAGVERALSLRPDVAIIDIGLPGLDGYEVARRVRGTAEGMRIKLVALTGYGQDDDRARAQAAGFDAHLVKPVAPGHLQRVLAEL